MDKLIYIALGGAVGSVLRYLVSGIFYRYSNGVFPLGTLGVNLIGSLCIGVLWGFFESVTVSVNVRSFLMIGLLGAFTTFSTFTLENFHLLRDGEMKVTLINILVSNVLGIIVVFASYFFIRSILSFVK